MNNKTILLSLTALVLGSLAVSPKLALAYQTDPNVQGPNYSQERHEIMEKAFANNDYNTWKSQMQEKGRVTQVINESNFTKFAQAHKLAEEGKIEEAKQIRTELGLGLRNGTGNRKGQGQQKGNGSSRWNK